MVTRFTEGVLSVFLPLMLSVSSAKQEKTHYHVILQPWMGPLCRHAFLTTINRNNPEARTPNRPPSLNCFCCVFRHSEAKHRVNTMGISVIWESRGGNENRAVPKGHTGTTLQEIQPLVWARELWINSFSDKTQRPQWAGLNLILVLEKSQIVPC